MNGQVKKARAEIQILIEVTNKANDIAIYTDDSVTRDQAGRGFTARQVGPRTHGVNGQTPRGQGFVCLLVDCLMSQQHGSVSQRQICLDKFTCCHTETEVADPTFYLTLSQYTDIGPTSPSADPITPGAW